MAVEERFEEDKGGLLDMATGFKHCHNGAFAIVKPTILTHGTTNGLPRDPQKVSNGVDDELTSLTWLQDTNLLKNFQMGSGGIEGEEVHSDCQSNDYIDEMIAQVTVNGEEKEHQGIDQMSLSGHLPYNPTVHTNSKPPFSFSCLIFMAIEDSLNKALPVKDIYNWILTHFPYFQNAPSGWKNSVRHNLSLSKCFRKVEKEKGQTVGKGSLWCIDPEFRPNLIQALQKAPTMANVEFSRFSCIPSSYCQNGKSERELKPCLLVSSQDTLKIPSPELFPYLSRRLASSMKDPEVDAAATMLTLKNGPNGPIHNFSEESESDSLNGNHRFPRKRLRVTKQTVQNPGRKRVKLAKPVITSSPSEDHTYSASLSQQNGRETEESSSYVSPPSDDEGQHWWEDSKSTSEENSASSIIFSCGPEIVFKKEDDDGDDDDDTENSVAEGANALMNLAKIATTRLLTKTSSKTS